ncbi:MAG: AAA family ATPase [Candidatus Anammoxibacter sp.]
MSLIKKGGTGKTTVATNLAANFAGNGTDILLVDADPQQSALDWQKDRDEKCPHVSVIGLPFANLHKEVGRLKTKYDMIIIDGGGRITANARAAVSVADFIIVPTLASKPDALSTNNFFNEVVEEVAAIKGHVAGAILFTMLKSGTVFNVTGQKQIKDLGFPVFNTLIYNRITYQEAIAQGKSAYEYNKRSKAAQEIQSLYKELKKYIPANKKRLK